MSVARRKQFSIAIKLKAVHLVVFAGQTPSEVVASQNIPPQTLHNWLKAWHDGRFALDLRLNMKEFEYLVEACQRRTQTLRTRRKKSPGITADELDILCGLNKKIAALVK